MTVRVCPRCICMHMKLADDALLQQKDFVLKKSLHDRWPHVSKALPDIIGDNGAAICHSCLGVLQDNFLMKFVEGIIQAFEKDKYKCINFKLNISLPVQLMLFVEHIENMLIEPLHEVRLAGRGYTMKEIVKVFVEPLLEKRLSLLAVSKEAADLEISVLLKHTTTETDLLPKIANSFPRIFSKFQHQVNNLAKKKAKVNLSPFNATTMGNLLKSLSSENLSALMDSSYFESSVEISEVNLLRQPLYLGGRYLKYSRELSQTPWILDGERKSEKSVKEFITLPTERLLGADGSNFVSSGREDVDVRMLGNGRPFLVEILNSRIFPLPADVMALEKDINKSTDQIQIKNFQSLKKEDLKLLKDGEEEKTKSYSALCYAELGPDMDKEILFKKIAEISSTTNVKIKQKTPIRVLHRRNLAVREREIYSMNASVIPVEKVKELVPINLKFSDMNVVFELKLTTQAGTYVKEFVHGDFGRTDPSMTTLLGARTDILSLDVTAVNLEWPPTP